MHTTLHIIGNLVELFPISQCSFLIKLSFCFYLRYLRVKWFFKVDLRDSYSLLFVDLLPLFE